MFGLGHLPSLENIQCFLAAAEHLNFRRAAEAMALTPAAFGQRIRQIEQHFDAPLFIRTTRHVELTAAGHRLIPVANDVLSHARRCSEVVHSDREPPARFTMGTRFELGMSWILPSLIELQDLYPSWHVDLYYGAGPDILAQLQNNQVDCIVTSAPVTQRDWEIEFLHPESYVFVGAPKLLDDVPFKGLEDAKHHTLLDLNNSLPLSRYLTSVTGAVEFDQIWLGGAAASTVKMALEGRGVGVLPEYMVRDHLADGSLVRLLPDVELLSDSFRLMYKKGHPLDRVLKSTAEFLRAHPLK